MTGPEIMDKFKEHLYDAWTQWRVSEDAETTDVAAFVHYEAEARELTVAFGAREDVLEGLKGEGVDITKHPELEKSASADAPVLSIAIWVIIGLKPATEKREVWVTRMIEPLLSRMSGPIGQA